MTPDTIAVACEEYIAASILDGESTNPEHERAAFYAGCLVAITLPEKMKDAGMNRFQMNEFFQQQLDHVVSKLVKKANAKSAAGASRNN